MTGQLAAFLAALLPEGHVDLRAFHGGPESDLDLAPAGDVARVEAFIRKNAGRKDVYFGVAARDGQGRGLESCLYLRAVFADIDFKDTPEAQARAALDSFPFAASAVVRSGGGLHPYFFLQEPIDLRNGGAGRAAELLRALCERVGGDPKSAEPARILRLPGTLNHKYDPPAAVELEALRGYSYRLEDIAGELGSAAKGSGAARSPTPERLPEVVGAGGRNQTLFREGSRLRRLGLQEAEISAALHAINKARCRPPLDRAEVERIATSCARYRPAEDAFPLTESGDAEYFAHINRDTVRFDHRRANASTNSASGQGWFVFGSHHWTQQTDGEVSRLALEAMRGRQAAALLIKDDDQRRAATQKWAIAGEARKRQLNMLGLAQSMRPLADAGDSWDTDPWALGVRNGVLDLRTGALRDGTPDDRITLVSPVVYDPAAPTARWRDFILAVCDGDRELADYLQVTFGYSITGLTGEQCFWILYGLGSNGKSTLLETLTRHVVPSHSWSMDFPSSTWSESLSLYQRAELVNRRLVVAKENEQAKRLNTEFIKSLTGTETIQARHPYCRPFNFTPAAKFFLAVNHKPVIRDDTHGMWRRVRLVPFLRTFKPDPKYAEGLLEDLPGILRWAVEGAARYAREGLPTPASVLAATEEYQKESGPLNAFIEERCVIADGTEVRAQRFFDAYRAWCDSRHMPDVERLSQNQVGERMTGDSRFRVVKKEHGRNRGVSYVGIGLLDTQGLV